MVYLRKNAGLLFAYAPYALVRADARSLAFLALAPLPLVWTHARHSLITEISFHFTLSEILLFDNRNGISKDVNMSKRVQYPNKWCLHPSNDLTRSLQDGNCVQMSIFDGKSEHHASRDNYNSMLYNVRTLLWQKITEDYPDRNGNQSTAAKEVQHTFS